MQTIKHTDGHEYGYAVHRAAGHRGARYALVVRTSASNSYVGEIDWDENPENPPVVLPNEKGDEAVLKALLPALERA